MLSSHHAHALHTACHHASIHLFCSCAFCFLHVTDWSVLPCMAALGISTHSVFLLPFYMPSWDRHAHLALWLCWWDNSRWGALPFCLSLCLPNPPLHLNSGQASYLLHFSCPSSLPTTTSFSPSLCFAMCSARLDSSENGASPAPQDLPSYYSALHGTHTYLGTRQHALCAIPFPLKHDRITGFLGGLFFFFFL